MNCIIFLYILSKSTFLSKLTYKDSVWIFSTQSIFFAAVKHANLLTILL